MQRVENIVLFHQYLSRRGFFSGELAAPRVLAPHGLTVGFGFAAAAKTWSTAGLHGHWVQAVQLHAVLPHQLVALHVIGDYLEGAGHHIHRLRPGGGVRVVRGPHQVVDANDRPVFHRLHVVDVGEKELPLAVRIVFIVSLVG